MALSLPPFKPTGDELTLQKTYPQLFGAYVDLREPYIWASAPRRMESADAIEELQVNTIGRVATEELRAAIVETYYSDQIDWGLLALLFRIAECGIYDSTISSIAKQVAVSTDLPIPAIPAVTNATVYLLAADDEESVSLAIETIANESPPITNVPEANEWILAKTAMISALYRHLPSLECKETLHGLLAVTHLDERLLHEIKVALLLLDVIERGVEAVRPEWEELQLARPTSTEHP